MVWFFVSVFFSVRLQSLRSLLIYHWRLINMEGLYLA
jgi:hypothetical protein